MSFKQKIMGQRLPGCRNMETHLPGFSRFPDTFNDLMCSEDIQVCGHAWEKSFMKTPGLKNAGVVLLMATLMVCHAQGAEPTPTTGPGKLVSCANIMPLGDSITLGPNGGYRNHLYTALQKKNCGVSYVGSQYDQYTRVADKDHEGHPGKTIGDIANEVKGWLNKSQPDIILLMAGTNDVAWWTTQNGTQIGARHDALIDQIQAARPKAWIFVASIPPESSSIIQPNKVDRATLTQQLNAAIRANVQARQSAGQKIRFVDVNSALTTADLYDGIHPTEAAHAKIAQKWLDALVPLLP